MLSGQPKEAFMAPEHRSGSRAKEISSILATWVGIVSAIIGGALTLRAYRTDVGKREDDAVVRAFDLAIRFDSREMIDLRNRVESALNKGQLYT